MNVTNNGSSFPIPTNPNINTAINTLSQLGASSQLWPSYNTAVTSFNNFAAPPAAPKLFKASIFFKFANGRRRNRTFPGDVNASSRSLLGEWARQFRVGESISSRPADKRRARTVSKRRNTTIITRDHAFSWFRESQQKYSALYHKKSNEEGKLNPYKKSPGIQSITPEVYVQKKVFNEKAKTIIINEAYNGKQFIEVEFDKLSFPEEPNAMYLMVGNTKVIINTLFHGRGAYFDATNIPIGIHTIEGVHGSIRFEVKGNGSKSSSSGGGSGRVATTSSSSSSSVLSSTATSTSTSTAISSAATSSIISSVSSTISPNASPFAVLAAAAAIESAAAATASSSLSNVSAIRQAGGWKANAPTLGMAGMAGGSRGRRRAPVPRMNAREALHVQQQQFQPHHKDF